MDTNKTATTKLIKQLVLAPTVYITVRFAMNKLGWHSSSLLARGVDHFNYDVEWNRVSPAMILWIVFSVFWAIA